MRSEPRSSSCTAEWEIAGTRDEDTPVAVMRALFAAAAPPKELWIEQGAHHGDNYGTDPAEYEARLVAFLAQAWPTAPAPP